ncbi:hypothetical protein CcaverHIS002_0507570 [Cutaneotrichosporon cavernicola]|uniref:Uncharacterized protein n=1 Tax=Cutaneotrichosporon cavernicola TaxID=279322 RepID=A0AA48L773_9TREE|nr:uncharacterized protein CcaverHIS019_0508130 [Cutaneotrichosporon cavernicola]BEI85356.1 hypothetical protein CcaverHIS002_0507570 [Cutaneotrichosporon cavernicola]BEI93185.1 hypothetical protein CcaverHIS019_0508130 [Cutaneotrichosporon cavernicola]BEJ00962.1 hypothetical protein CcaverHIS631_0508190 [Cutaneotrichosporon cavernicola]BEJ08727.1 hypothetical protein CcaverHIS641_0508210 [Cutaneotrichosporon cavernicola]
MTFITIPRLSSASSSATTSPLASPTTGHQDRLNAFLTAFEAGTHAFSRGDEWADGARVSKSKSKSKTKHVAALATPQQPEQAQEQSRRPSWANALSILRDEPRHFDPSRDPKLHALI